MKLLFDQNISYKIVRKVDGLFPRSEQVKRIGCENKSDRFLWDFAKRSGFTIVTHDSDFHQLSQQFGHPPKVIWLKLKNQTTQNVEKALYANLDRIRRFAAIDKSCLEIDR